MAAAPEALHLVPVTGDRLAALHSAVAGFDREQLLWSSGFLAGMAAAAEGSAPAELPPKATNAWTVFYATETGNSRRVAEALAARTRADGVASELHDLSSFKPKALARVERAVFVVATHGIGEAPEGTEAFFEFWFSERAPRLEQLQYSVLALGDSSYADYCETGRRLDERLRALGARPVVDRVECDVDYEDAAKQWTADILRHAARDAVPAAQAAPRPGYLRAVTATSTVTRERPFRADVTLNQRITGRQSSKDVRHIELDLEGSGISYLPGDSIGVLPRNHPELVAALLDVTRLDADDEVTVGDRTLPLQEALANEREITVLNRPLIEHVAARYEALNGVLANRERFTEFVRSRQVIDLLSDHPGPWKAQGLVDSLRRLAPRLYSIASSPDANPGEAHIAVSVVHYRAFDRWHWGAASTYVAGDVESVPVFVETNERFRLPDDGDTPIVMIGAGTGIAPYRAFVEHRLEQGHRGDNWLIYGDRNFASDFLYQLEWLRYRQDGVLTRMDVAFSRDRAQKEYVQHRVAEQSRRVYDWLERGAHVYVCGDAQRMAIDVHAALRDALVSAGGLDGERAEEYLKTLKAARRYQRDVY